MAPVLLIPGPMGIASALHLRASYALLLSFSYASLALGAVELDTLGLFSVTANFSASGQEIAVVAMKTGTYDGLDPILRSTLKSELRVSVEGRELPVYFSDEFASRNARATSGTEPTVNLFRRQLGGGNGEVKLNQFDLRGISLHGKKYGSLWQPGGKPAVKPAVTRSDLHTHYGGALTYESILEVALQHKMPYPANLLKELLISFPPSALAPDGKSVILSPALLRSTEWRESRGSDKFQAAMSFHPAEITNLVNMELKYRYRGPIVKYGPAFGDFLKKLAQEYSARGIDYVELSIADILKPEFLAQANQVVPEIEKATGVRIRFLAALWRHSPTQFNLDMLERMRALKHNPLVVGMDVMGHETNSTRAFLNVLEEAVAIGREIHPEFQIRVHAGENPLYPENVREVVKLAAKTGGKFRVGHGIHGDLDKDTLRMAAHTGTVIEGNPGSNQALNNGLIMKELVAAYGRYLLAGIPFVVATDGHGLYGGDPAEFMEVFRQSGMSEAGIATMVKTEADYISRMEKVYDAKIRVAGCWRVPTEAEMPEAKFTGAMWVEINRAHDALLAEIADSLAKSRVKVHETREQLKSSFAGRIPIHISVTSKRGWPELDPAVQQQILYEFSELTSLLDPQKVFLITGGTKYDGEGSIQKDAVAAGHSVVGTYVTDSQRIVEELGTLTDAIWAGEKWHDKSPFVLQLVKEMGGVSFFVGGRDIMKDEIIAAKNVNCRFQLRGSMEGASGYYSKLMPERSYASVAEMVAAIYEIDPALFRNGVSQQKVQGYLESVRRMRGIKTSVDHGISDSVAEAVQKIGKNHTGKKILTFVGYSATGYQDRDRMLQIAADTLKNLNPAEWVVNIGITPNGIGEIYALAKAKGFETIGVGSSKYGPDASLYVDHVYLVRDQLSGGYLEGTKTLSPTSETIVTVSDRMIGIGGNKVAQDEMTEMDGRGKSVEFHSAEMNHFLATNHATRRNRPAPTLAQMQGIRFIPRGAGAHRSVCATLFAP